MQTATETVTDVPQATEWPPEAKLQPVDFSSLFPLGAIIAAPTWVLLALSGATHNETLRYVAAGFLALAVVVTIALAICMQAVAVSDAARTRRELAQNPHFAQLAQEAKLTQNPKTPLFRPLAHNTPMLLIGALALGAVIVTVCSGVL
jgi:hypothetical protein